MAELRLDLAAVRRNTAAVADLLASVGIRLVGVTKGCGGDARVAAAMLEGGAVALADTRDAHLIGLRAAFPDTELHRILLPSLVSPFVSADVCYVSSVETAVRVAEGGTPDHPVRVMVQVETGDLREGVPSAELLPLLRAVVDEPRLRLAGLSSNYACFEGDAGGIRRSVERLAEDVRAVREAGFEVPRVSGGNSSLLALVVEGIELPGEITEIRCGEALLLGQDALLYRRLPGCDAGVVLRAEVLEGYTKMSAEGHTHRLVLGVGHQDIGGGALSFARLTT